MLLAHPEAVTQGERFLLFHFAMFSTFICVRKKHSVWRHKAAEQRGDSCCIPALGAIPTQPRLCKSSAETATLPPGLKIYSPVSIISLLTQVPC